MSYFSDASLVFIPSAQKSGKAYSVKPTDGTGDLSFTRSNDTATRVGPDGLIEKVRTNLVTYSQDFSNAAWSKSAGTTLTHSQTDPDGGTTATRVVMTSGTNNFFTQAISGSGTRFITLSVWVKGVTTGGTLSLNTGTAASRTGTTITYTTTWTRYEIIQNETTSNTGIQIDNFSDSVGQVAGDFLIAFAQVESSDFGATDYIATTSAAVSVGPVANVPRLDYLGSSCPRLLLEPQRTNLVFYSEQLNNAGWAAGAVVTANTAVSPDGYTNADSVMESATTDYQIIGDAVATTSGTAYTFSFFAKPNGRNFARVLFGNGSFPDNQSAYFNLLTGATSATASVTASMVSYGNGWYRCIATITSDANATDACYFGPARNMTDGYTTYAGNASVGIYAWGAQQEAGAYATSYIPTLGAAVTRGTDTVYKTGISSLIGQTEGTIYWETQVDTPSATGYETFLNVDGGSFNDTIYMFKTAGASFIAEVYDNGVLQATFSKSGVTAGFHKLAIGYANNNTAFFVDGVQVGTTDTSCSVPTMSRIQLGQNVFGPSTDRTAQVLLFPTRLSNDSLAALTA